MLIGDGCPGFIEAKVGWSELNKTKLGARVGESWHR